MPRHPVFHRKLQELVVDERLSDTSSPKLQREIEAYKKAKELGINLEIAPDLGRAAIEWEDAETEQEDTDRD